MMHDPLHTPLGPGAEFDRIRAIWRRLGSRVAAAGDDAAIVQLGDARVAISSDMSVEGTHFRRAWVSPREIGWRAAAAALSDLAAVAAQPIGVMASVAVPADDLALAEELMEGVAAVAAPAGAVVWGGDLVRADRIVVDCTVVGTVTRPVLRAGAEPGDLVFVTGALGGPAEAIAAWEGGEEPEAGHRARFATPEPRIGPGQWLRDRGAKAMIDLSDGLLGDAGHLAAASAVRCTIVTDLVPLYPDVTRWQSMLGGEEYELLVALPAKVASEAAGEFGRTFGIPLSRIGTIDSGTGVRLEREGREVAPPHGFSHF